MKTDIVLARLRDGLERIYRDRLRGVYLYGSYARGDSQPDSDLDVLIFLDRIQQYGAEISMTSELISVLSLETGVSLSRVFVPEREWKEGRSSFLENVREEAVAA
jgi:predicted nucleotidyltransferase